MSTDERMSYIVPAKILLGVVVKATQEEVNTKTTEVIKSLEGNKELKQMMFDVSRKMTEICGNEAMFVIIPDFIPPEENQDYSKMISSFINEMINTAKHSEGANVGAPTLTI